MMIELLDYGPGQPDGLIPGAGTLTKIIEAMGQEEASYITLQVFLTFAGAGGTTIDVYLQTSLDNGQSWWDVIHLGVLAATVEKAASIRKYIAQSAPARLAAVDGTLALDTVYDGFFGQTWRIKYVIVGTYAADNTFRTNIFVEKLRS